MIKDLFLAIILGALLGFGITGGYYAFNKHKDNSSASSVTPTIVQANNNSNQQITPTPVSKNDNLIINSPANNSIVSTSKITLTGITTSNSTIIVTTTNKSYTVNSGQSGNFNLDIELESGFNQIQITVIDSQDNQTDTTLNITYSTAKI